MVPATATPDSNAASTALLVHSRFWQCLQGLGGKTPLPLPFGRHLSLGFHQLPIIATRYLILRESLQFAEGLAINLECNPPPNPLSLPPPL